MITAERPSANKAAAAKKPVVNVEALIERGSSSLDESATRGAEVPATDPASLLKEHYVQLRLPQYLINQIARCRKVTRQAGGKHKKASQHTFLIDAVTTSVEAVRQSHDIAFGPDETCPPSDD